MKKVFVIALVVVGMTAFAQEKGGSKPRREKLSSEQKVDFQVKKMTKDLDLNEKQVSAVKELVAKQVQKRDAKKAEMTQIQDKKREEMRATMQKEQAVFSAEMKKVLTADQFTKWEQNRDERKEKLKERMMERKESNDLPERK